MPLSIPLIEDALIHILRNPDTVIPGGHPDINRREAAADLALLAYSVHLGRTPQNSPSVRGQMAVTLSRQSGVSRNNTDSFGAAKWPIFDLTTWAKTDGSRVNLETLLTFGQLLTILLVGLTGTFKDVEICTIHSEIEPFESDEAPADGSPDWVSAYVYPLTVIHRATTASQRVATGA